MVSGLSGIKDLINHLENREEKKKIFIIDDDPGFISLIRGWLKDDFKVFMSTSGDMAIDWLSKNSCDLILLDYEMPDTNGPEMLAKIKALGVTTPIVYITGNEGSEIDISIESCPNGLRPDGCIFKTSGKDEILKSISSFLK